MTMANDKDGLTQFQENFDDFFEQTLCGFIIADTKGTIIRANTKVAEWVGSTKEELKGKRFSDLLAIGGKIYYETHLGPLLRMQGYFEEVALELASNRGLKLQVLVNALERRDNDGTASFIRFTIVKASDRLQYEQNLRYEKRIAEEEILKQKEMLVLKDQLIAVLGHDLRNPLSAISMAAELLGTSVEEKDALLVTMISQSSSRMYELVDNLMDFARARLGDGITLNLQLANLEPVLQQVITELKLANPQSEIITSFELPQSVTCDPHRIGQLLSNLLANALTHGDSKAPVYIHAKQEKNIFTLSVCNSGNPIPPDVQDDIFAPFKREESRPSRNGLGLGLYICKEIARAHEATLEYTSNAKETCFTFQMQ